MNQLLERYRIAVRHAGASGFEHLDMLLVRDRLAQNEAGLSEREKAQLADADQRLLEQVAQFHEELARITDLAEERRRRKISTERWWWYLDVLRFLPLGARPAQESANP